VFFTEGPREFWWRLSDWRAARTTLPARDPLEFEGDWVFAGRSARIHPGVPVDPARPEVSVVVVAWNALEELKACLTSVVRAGGRRTFEVVVVDNGSRADVLDWLCEWADQGVAVRVVRLDENTGFAHGTNVGAAVSRGRFLALLNSDTVVTDDWLDRLVDILESDTSIGLVSPSTNYVGEGPQLDHDAANVDASMAASYAARVRYRDPVHVSERLTFFCVVVRRDLFELLNGLDEGYGVGNFEDDDFCARIEFLGYGLVVARGVFIYHKGSATFRDNNVDHGAWMTRNALRRLEKLSALSISPPLSTRRRSGNGGPLVSVVVRTKDRPDTLRLALNSLANQTLESFEVVLVNSGDSVADIVADFERSLRMSVVTPAPGLGLGDLLNSGVEAAKGRFVTYLDDDDIVYPFHLAALVDAIGADSPGERFVYSHYSLSFVVRSDEGPPKVIERRRLPLWDYAREDLLVRNAPALHTWLHSKSLIDRIGGFDSTLPVLEDWEFLLRATGEIDLISHPRETCEYRLSLDFSSAIARRETALIALRDIYSRYPSSSAKTERDRRAELNAQESQVALVASVIRRHAAGEILTLAAVRELAMCTFSVALPAGFKLDSEVEQRWTPVGGRAGPTG
jgi:GT2 family glycosyltransferase